MIARSLGTRLVASLAIAGAVALSAAGCSYLAPQATLIHYDAADGVSADLGDVLLRNAQAVVGSDDSSVNVTFSAVNTATKPITLHYSAPTASGQDAGSIDVKPGITTVGSGSSVIVVDAPKGAALGGLYGVTFTADGADSVTLQIPVLDTQGRPHLDDLVP